MPVNIQGDANVNPATLLNALEIRAVRASLVAIAVAADLETNQKNLIGHKNGRRSARLFEI